LVLQTQRNEPINPDCLSARIFPNPVNETSKAIISKICSNALIYYSIQDISGKILKSGEITPLSNEVEQDIGSLPIVAGSYILSLQQLDVVRRFKMMKVE
jgi:hypothetical protein